jgi:DNA-binding transcriptional MerR regulator
MRMPEPELMTIQQMCADFGVTARSLRFYESKDLLAPVRKGQHRLFTPRDRARLQLILRGKRFGFSLAEIKELLDLYDADETQQAQLSTALERAEIRLRAMKRQRVELDEAIAELEGQMAQVAEMLKTPEPRKGKA